MNIKNIKTLLLSTFLISILLIIPLVSLADQVGTPPTDQVGTPPTSGQTPSNYKITIPSPLKSSISDIPSLIRVLITDVVTPIGGIIAVLMVMYAGFLFVTAQGAQAQITKAKDTLLYAAIGAAILLGAEVVAIAIKSTVDKLGA